MTKMTEGERETALDEIAQGFIDDSRRRVEAAVARIRKGEPAVEESSTIDAANVRRRDAERDARAEHVNMLLEAYGEGYLLLPRDIATATRRVAEEVSAIVRFPVVVFAVFTVRDTLAARTHCSFVGYPLPGYRHPLL